jgi:ABC-type Fe3+-hydroxamate transport system substrate-binding protein
MRFFIFEYSGKRYNAVCRGFSQVCIAAFLCAAAAGCAGFNETCRGIAGTSVKILEDKRAEAVTRTFESDMNTVSGKIEQALEKMNAYVYARENDGRLIAVYVSESDTTPVGIFMTQEAGGVRVEVSSPSGYAKETVAQNIFAEFDAKPKPGKVSEQAPDEIS